MNYLDSLKLEWAKRRAAILKMVAQGHKKGEIAAKFGIHPSRVSHIVKRYGKSRIAGNGK